MKRVLNHFFTTRFALTRAFPKPVLDAIEHAIADAEKTHTGEIRFAIETALAAPALLEGVTARERAVEVFSALGVWDTAANNGVLIYVLLAERDIEIVWDRGYNEGADGAVDEAEWRAVADAMRIKFANGHFEAGALEGIAAVSDIIARHFPGDPEDRDELPNRPALL